MGGGYNVSEVKYMDETVWSDGNEYKFKLSPYGEFDTRIYVNNVRLSENHLEYINVKLDYVNVTVAFSHTQRGAYVKLFVGEDNVFDELIYGEADDKLYYFSTNICIKSYYLSEKNTNYIKAVIS